MVDRSYLVYCWEKNIASVDGLLQLFKLLECFCLLISWTSATDEYQDEEYNGRLIQLSFFVVVAVISWMFTVLWLILKFTKVYSFLRITPLVNTLIHSTLSTLLFVSSLMVITDRHVGSILSMDKSSGVLGLIAAIFLIIDAVSFLLLDRTEAD